MRTTHIIFLSFSCYIAAQNTLDLYSLEFHNQLIRENLNMENEDFKKLIPNLKDKYDFIEEEGAMAYSAFNVIEILTKNNCKIKRIFLRCDDCKREYYLFYQSANQIELIESTTPETMLIDIMRLFLSDGRSLSESDVSQLSKETYFGFKYNNFYKNYSNIPAYLPRK